MQGKDFIIGTLKSSGCLKTKSEEILLTKIPTQAAQSPESAILKVAMEDVGKMSILRGKLSEKEEYALIQIGKLQNFIAEPEYQFDIGKLDVVWRRVPQSVPTYVFEIQISGNVYQALAKLKHAFDLWNSHVFLVSPQEDLSKVLTLLSGTFHEIRDRLKFVDCFQVKELLARKKGYRDLEKELGIL